MLRWKSSLKPAAAAPGGGTNPGTSNLVAWLGMEEGSGTDVDDSTSNNNDFTLTNGSWVTGKVGSYAVRLDGTGDYMDSDANFAVGANVCTVSFWMYWTDSGSDEKFIYELGNRWWQNNGSIAFSWVQNESVFKVSMHDGSGNLEVKFPEPSSGQWVYVTVVHNGPGGSSNAGEIKLYYDGTAQSYSSYSSTKNAASNIGQAGSLFFIGANSTGAQEITIDVDTFAVFSDELTQDEITWLYNSGNGRSYSDVSGYTVIPQLDVTQDNSNTFSNNKAQKFNAADVCFSTGSDHSSAITVNKVDVQLKKTGTPTGALTCYLYEPATPTSEGVPDDRVGTADAVLSMSSISDSDYATYSFTFTGQSELAAGRWLLVVLYASDSTGVDGSNYIEWAGDSFVAGSWSMQQRTNGAPSATNDASSWTNQIDGNGAFYVKVYQAP